MIRVVVAGTHALARSGIRAILNEAPDIDAAGEVDGSRSMLAAVQRFKPDVVLFDVQPRDFGTIEVVRKLVQAEAKPKAQVLALIASVDKLVREMLQAGSVSLLLRDAEPAQLFAAIRVVAAGYSVVVPVDGALNSQALHNAVTSVRDERFSALTPREREVFGLVVRGYSNGEIAARLTLSESTVKYHVQGLLNKLGLHDRVHAVIFAYETGLLHPRAGTRMHERS